MNIMKKLISFCLLFSILLISCEKKEIAAGSSPPFSTPGSKLPLFQIETNTGIENEPKVPGYLKIYDGQALVFEHNIGIEYRGSTSFRLSDKKSYGFETWDEGGEDINTSILGYPEEEDWILTGHVFRASTNTIFDPTLMRHFVGYELYRAMGNYASRCKFVELAVNGDFLGTYVFMEKLKRDKNRIDIKKLNSDEKINCFLPALFNTIDKL